MDETEFSFNYEADYDKNVVKALNYKFSHRMQFSEADETVTVNLKVILASQDEQTEYARNSIRAVFGVRPFKEVFDHVNDETYQMKAPKLISTFINVAIGALRGFLVKNLKGTPLHECVLPLIPMDMVNEMLTKKAK